MITVYKYPLNFELQTQKAVIKTHGYGKIQKLDGQKEPGGGTRICLWIRVNTDEALVERTFQLFATGQPICAPEDYDDEFSFVGTVFIDGGALVFHVYERP